MCYCQLEVKMMNILDWNTYLNHLREMIDNLKRPLEYTDVTLNCENSEEFKVHKIVLSACSPAFRGIIRNLKKNIPVLYLKGIKQQEMDSVLESVFLDLAKYHEERMKEFSSMAKNFETKTRKVEISSKDEVSEPNDSMMMLDYDKNLEGFTVDFLSNTMDIKEDHDTQIAINKDENNQKFACSQCDKAYGGIGGRASLQRHVKATHEGFRYSCNECDKHYTDQSALRIHNNTVHNPIECKECPFITATTKRLEEHIQKVHEGVRYPCNKCDVIAASQGQLNRHIQSNHAHSPQKHNLSIDTMNTPVAKKAKVLYPTTLNTPVAEKLKVLNPTESDVSKSVPTYKMPKQITMTKVPAYKPPKQITQNRQISFSRI